jgi:VWFA-related protein
MGRHRSRLIAATSIALLAGAVLAAQQREPGAGEQSQDGFRFRTGVELINVTATVTDSSGRFVPNLRQEDFVVYEDGEPQQITHFSAERVPVSLGIALDTSGSMSGEKFEHAEAALDRFLFDLLDRDDEVFLYRFNNDAVLEQNWTTDRGRVSQALRRITPRGGTAMYDAVAEAVPLADSGRNRKKALVVISDGNDTASQATVEEIQQLIRETEVMGYAIGIDGAADVSGGVYTPRQPRRPPIQIPFPFPIPGRRGGTWPRPMPPPSGGSQRGTWSQGDDRVNVAALRAMTDDSGGRTEIVRTSRDLDPATAGIADELSKQYFFAYPAAAKKDGRWHTIRVEVRDGRYHVRARRGYMAT